MIKTIDYVRGRPFAPSGSDWDNAVAVWKYLHSDADAAFDRIIEIDAAQVQPCVNLGHFSGDGNVN